MKTLKKFIFLSVLFLLLTTLFIFSAQSLTSAAAFSADRNGTKTIPVLTYHCIDDKPWSIKSLFVSVKDFDRQMKYLRDNNYTPIDFGQLKDAQNINKPVIITFDDGYEDNYTKAYPILKKYNMKATIFVISGYINKKWYLKASQIKKMTDLVDFQDHTFDHPHLKSISSKRIEYEMIKSKKAIEKITGKAVCCLSYPYGEYDKRVLSIAQRHFTYGVTTKFGFFYKTEQKNEYQIKRIDVKMNDFIRLIKF